MCSVKIEEQQKEIEKYLYPHLAAKQKGLSAENLTNNIVSTGNTKTGRIFAPPPPKKESFFNLFFVMLHLPIDSIPSVAE